MTDDTQASYPVPPISEAIIELRFDSDLDEDAQGRLVDRFAQAYPQDNVEPNYHVQIDTDSQAATFKHVSTTHRRLDAEGLEMFMIGKNFISVAQLPIYPGWDAFVGRLKRDWSVVKSTLGYRKLARIGVRYINKLDFPYEEGMVDPGRYLTLFVQSPDAIGFMVQSALSSVHNVPDLEAVMQIQSATIESLLPKHLGMLLDIDVGRTSNVPQKDDAIFDYLEKVRHFKNGVFEACITDETRKTFYDDLRLGS